MPQMKVIPHNYVRAGSAVLLMSSCTERRPTISTNIFFFGEASRAIVSHEFYPPYRAYSAITCEVNGNFVDGYLMNST